MHFNPAIHARFIVMCCFGSLSQSLLHAQDLSMQVAGQISQSTCTVVFTDPKTGVSSNSKTITFAFGNGNTGNGNFGSALIPALEVTFSLKDASGVNACILAGGNANWDLSLALGANQILTVAGEGTFLTNSISVANGGTDAVIKLDGGTLSSGMTRLNLSAGGNNYVSNATTPSVTTSQTLTLRATFVRGNTTGTSVAKGVYIQSIPVTLVYK